MRNSARVVIIEDDKVLTMFRRKIKDGKVSEYYVIPGGGVEEGEASHDTAVRELKEEMNVDVDLLGYLGKREGANGEEFYYHGKIKEGQTPMLGGEELDRMTEENYYEPRFVEINKLDEIDIFGKDFVLKAIR